jgi:mannitol-1-phosphate 5-dehydrogenase
MKAVMYGAGNIGRGFIGATLAGIGYEVVFIDVNDKVIEAMNTDHKYPQEIVGPGARTNWITGIRAVDGKDEEAVAEEIATADIMATSVGVGVLEKIVPFIVKGCVRRWQRDPHSKIDLLICENLMDADKILGEWMEAAMPDAYQGLMKENLGLVETSIGRMVPIMTDEMRKGDFLRVCVEEYDYLPVDQDAFKGEIPKYEKLVPYSPFGFYLERKLYIHNMAHAMTAFLGNMDGKTYIHEAISNLAIRKIVQGAMTESAMMISKKYGVPYDQLQANIDDLLYRFQNAALKDTTARVGRDPLRKLKPKDRLVGAARGCMAQEIPPVHLALGIAAALKNVAEEKEEAIALLREHAQIREEESLGRKILEFYDFFAQKDNRLEDLIPKIDQMIRDERGSLA